MADSKGRVLVTGVTGTVGSEIAARLIEEGYAVRALVRSASAPELERLDVEAVKGDLTDSTTLSVAVQGVDAVVHAAAYIGPDWERARAVNVAGTKSIADAAALAGVKHFVHISTGSVYNAGDRTEITEETPLCEASQNAYSQTKADAERAVRAAADRGLPIAILRLGMVLSAHRTSVWGPKLIDEIRQGKVWHSDDPVNYIHVRNIPDALLLVMQDARAVGEAYNLIDGTVPASAFFGRIATWLGEKHTEPGRAPGVRRVVTEKIQRLGYKPRYTFDDAMAELEETARSSGWV